MITLANKTLQSLLLKRRHRGRQEKTTTRTLSREDEEDEDDKTEAMAEGGSETEAGVRNEIIKEKPPVKKNPPCLPC